MRGVSVLPQTALEIQSLLKTFFFGVVERIQEESWSGLANCSGSISLKTIFGVAN